MPRGRRPAEPDYDVVAPDAAAMIESLRAFGYDLPTAIADLIDNSIAAGASNVWLTFFWDGAHSYISLADDGRGMSEDTLVSAMRAGSCSPLHPRAPSDLGRFGLGLKTASFSQCRRLTVASRTEKLGPAVRRWDLDHVQRVRDWQLLRHAAQGSQPKLGRLESMLHGTIVLWEQMDRLVEGTTTANQADHKRFLEHVDHVEAHIGMVFHRFLKGRNALRIFINGEKDKDRVAAWDPFLEDEPATQADPPESFETDAGTVEVQPYVLPHHDRLTKDAHREAAGPAGWNAQQGFYVYRNRRLLVPGDWLGLGFTKEEHYKLARIRIDIPNTADTEWNIDVKKSTARPPGHIRKRLRWIAEEVRKKAVAVYRHRGNVGPRREGGPADPAWVAVQQRGRTGYRINREHPLVAKAMAGAKDFKPVLAALLRLLEETVPIRRIWLEETESPDAHARPFELAAEREITEVIRQVFAALRIAGVKETDAWERIGRMEAFAAYSHLIESLRIDVGTPAGGSRP